MARIWLFQFDFHGDSVQRVTTNNAAVESMGQTWNPAAIVGHSIPGAGTDVESADVVNVSFADISAWRAHFLPRHIFVDLTMWLLTEGEDGAADEVRQEFVGKSVGMNELDQRLTVTFHNRLAVEDSTPDRLVLSEFATEDDDFLRYADEVRAAAWSGTPIGS